MEQAPIEGKIIKQCMREGLPLPKKIANAPSLHIGTELYYDAFWELSTCRSSGWGLGPIPWSAANDYALTFEFDGQQREALFHHIRVMDNAFIIYNSPKDGKKKWQSQEGLGSSGDGWSSSAKR